MGPKTRCYRADSAHRLFHVVRSLVVAATDLPVGSPFAQNLSMGSISLANMASRSGRSDSGCGVGLDARSESEVGCDGELFFFAC
jgi:hypothetical protein